MLAFQIHMEKRSCLLEIDWIEQRDPFCILGAIEELLLLAEWSDSS